MNKNEPQHLKNESVLIGEMPQSFTEKLAELAKRYGIRLVVLFGSSIAGRLHERSDVDLGVLFNSPIIDLSELLELQHQLQLLYLDKKLDLAILNHADPLFLKKVTDECRLLYGEVSDLQLLKIYVFRRYQDHKRFFDLERRFVARFIDEVTASS